MSSGSRHFQSSRPSHPLRCGRPVALPDMSFPHQQRRATSSDRSVAGVRRASPRAPRQLPHIRPERSRGFEAPAGFPGEPPALSGPVPANWMHAIRDSVGEAWRRKRLRGCGSHRPDGPLRRPHREQGLAHTLLPCAGNHLPDRQDFTGRKVEIGNCITRRQYYADADPTTCPRDQSHPFFRAEQRGWPCGLPLCPVSREANSQAAGRAIKGRDMLQSCPL